MHPTHESGCETMAEWAKFAAVAARDVNQGLHEVVTVVKLPAIELLYDSLNVSKILLLR
jgi:hypothetical protein